MTDLVRTLVHRAEVVEAEGRAYGPGGTDRATLDLLVKKGLLQLAPPGQLPPGEYWEPTVLGWSVVERLREKGIIQ